MSIRRNALYNLVGATLPIAVSLLTVPAYLERIGEARFGILSVAWLLLGYFGLFDLGLGVATAQQIAAREKGGKATQARIFWTALLTNLALGIGGGVIAWPVAEYYFGHILKVDPVLRSEIVNALPWLILAVPLATVTGVATGTLQGLSRFARLNIVSILGTVLFQVLPLVAALVWSPRLTVLLPIAILARAATLLMLLVECRRCLLRGQPIRYDRSEIRLLLHFGFWVTVPCFFVPLLSMIDRFAIGAFISAAAVTIYVVPLNLGDRISIVGNSAASVLFPSFSSLSKEHATELAYNSERLLLAVMLLISVSAIFLIAPFMSLWLGPDFSRRSAPIGEILMAGVWFDSLSRVPLFALRGQFRPEAVAKIELIQLVPYWIVLYLLISAYGIEGVAVAFVFRVAANYALLARETRSLTRMSAMLAAAGRLILIALIAARTLSPLGGGWAVAFSCCLLVALALAWRFAPMSQRTQLSGWLRRTLPPLQGRPR